MKKKLVQIFLTAILISSMTMQPVFATPSINDMEATKAQTQGEVDALQKELTANLEKITKLEEEIAQKGEEISRASEDLEEAINEQNRQYDAMKLRIKYMYEEGDADLFEVFLTADSLSDFINQVEYVQNVHSYDRQKLNDYIETKEEIEQLKEGLEQEAKELEQKQVVLNEERAALNASVAEKQDQIASLDAQIQEALEAQRAAQEEAEREARRQQELQQAQQQQQQQQQNQNTGTTNNNSQNTTAPSNPTTPSVTVPPQGRDGWAVVQYARQFLGNPYVYGGNSLTNGIDCSGFTQQVYRAFGVSLGRTDAAQAYAGVGIPLSEAQAGDLIVYWGHVGIYNGTGGLIHASSPSVGIVEFASCQYRSIRCVRRVL